PLAPSTFGVRYDPAPLASAAIFPDRDVFRPGEMLHLKGIARRGMLGSLTTPRRDSVRVIVRRKPREWSDDDSLIVRDTVVALSKFGTVTDSLPLPARLTLGSYTAQLQMVVGTAWRVMATTEIRLAEYRAPEFLVFATSDSIVRRGGDTAVFP